jgi:hypothetical protein
MEYGHFFAMERSSQSALGGAQSKHLLREIALNDRRMNIVFPARGGTIPKFGCGGFDRSDDFSLGLCFGLGRSNLIQLAEHVAGPMPRPEVLGRDIFPCDLPQIIVDVSRSDRL